jgi:hypothetical protein
MKILQALVVVVGVVGIALPTSVRAQCSDERLTDFGGETQHLSAQGVFPLGEVVTGYEKLSPVPPLQPEWYPWNRAAYEYTLVWSGTVSYSVRQSIGGGMYLRELELTGVTFSIYEDAGTAASYTNPATFTDGLLILSGFCDNPNAVPPLHPALHGGVWSGSLTGLENSNAGVGGIPLNATGNTAHVTGGAGQALAVCSSFQMNDNLSWANAAPLGYREEYNSEWKCCPTSTAVGPSTWGRVKSLYR